MNSPNAAVASLMASIGTSAQLNTAWNIRNIVTASTSMPHTGCITTRSMRSLVARLPTGSRTATAEDAAHLALGVEHVVESRRLPGPRHGGSHRRVECFEQALRAVAVHADRLDHRHAEFARQSRAVDHDALLPGHVGHVERHHHRQAQALGLEHQPQVEAQVGRVGHADQQVGQRLLALARDDVARDGLVGATAR